MAKLGNIVAETMFLVLFPGVAKLGNICFGRNICVRAAKFVSAAHVSRAAKLGNICIRNNVSATMFPSLARPLEPLNCKFQVVIW